MSDVLVFVPGGLGSELWDGDEKIWPPRNVLTGYNEQQFQRLLKPELEPKDIFRRVGLIPIYADWISTLESIKRNGRPLFTEAEQTLRCVPYDWRRSVADAALRLGDVVDQVVRNEPQARVHILAHSLGGLVARYFLINGRPPAQVKSLITIGAPHQGAPIAVVSALGKHAVQLLTKYQTQRLANQADFPALYQIFPHPDLPVFWRRQRINPENLYSETVAAELGLNPNHLQAAQDLHRALQDRLSVRVLQLVGTQFSTITHLLWSGGDQVDAVESVDSGDGAVPVASALHRTQACFTAGSHMKLLLAQEAKQALAAYFEAEIERLELATAPSVDITPREFAIAAEDYVEIVVSGKCGPLRSGVLSFERIDDGAVAAGDSFPIDASDAGQRLTLRLKHNLPPGVFRPVFTETDTGNAANGDPFAVMAPRTD